MSKSSFASKLLIALACALLLQISSQQNCSMIGTGGSKNAYVLSYLKSKGVTIMDIPTKITDSALCGGLWNNGTCCDIASVKGYINTVNNKAVDNWKQYMSKLAKIRAKLIGPLKRIFKASKLESFSRKINLMKADKEKYGNSFSTMYALLPVSQQQLNTLIEYTDKFDEKLKDYQNQGKGCFNAMKTFKANIACAACSANASSYIASSSTNGANFVYNMEDCKYLLGKCFAVWKFNAQVVTMTQYFSMLRLKYKTATAKFESSLSMPQMIEGESLTMYAGLLAGCSLFGNNELSCQGIDARIQIDKVIPGVCTFNTIFDFQVGLIEGYAGIDSLITDDDIRDAEKTADDEVKEAATVPITTNTTAQTSRLLQTTATNLLIMASPNTTSSSTIGSVLDTGFMINANSGLVPDATVETSNAGTDDNAPTKESSRIMIGVTGIICSIMIMF